MPADPENDDKASVWRELARMEAEVVDPEERETTHYNRDKMKEMLRKARALPTPARAPVSSKRPLEKEDPLDKEEWAPPPSSGPAPAPKLEEELEPPTSVRRLNDILATSASTSAGEPPSAAASEDKAGDAETPELAITESVLEQAVVDASRSEDEAEPPSLPSQFGPTSVRTLETGRDRTYWLLVAIALAVVLGVALVTL